MSSQTNRSNVLVPQRQSYQDPGYSDVRNRDYKNPAWNSRNIGYSLSNIEEDYAAYHNVELRHRTNKLPSKTFDGEDPVCNQETIPGSRNEKKSPSRKSEDVDKRKMVWKRFLYPVNRIVGIIIMLILACKVSEYLELLHENELWFTNLKEVEREISFRTEQGLYYSYYKQLVLAPDLQGGLQRLMNDNFTEQGRTINVLARFNIYQEIILSGLYRIFNLQNHIKPIFFYIKSVFFLHGLYMCALYLITWMLSASWLAGALCVCFYVFNRDDATRVNYTIPLRESFSIPLLFIQTAFVTYILRRRLRKWEERASVIGTVIFTVLYSITWQFAPFIMLLQTVSLFLLAISFVAPKTKITKLLSIHLGSLLFVCFLQFGQPLIMGSLVISFLPSAILILSVQENLPCKGIPSNIVRVLFRITFVIVITITLNVFMKSLFSLEADEHIFKFIKAKLGFENPRDFESKLYLCNKGFQILDMEAYQRLSKGLVLIVYTIIEFAYLSSLVASVLLKWGGSSHKKDGHRHHQLLMEHRPDLAYHIVLTVFLALMAISTMRMKCLWVPHMCILASVGISDTRMWRSILGWLTSQTNCVRHLATFTFLALLVYRSLPVVMDELEDLKEFWDPDTVELMEWINLETPSTAAFAGSMQLLAGVKLCTGRPITNHPHFEDKWLRERTKQVYQMYARQPPHVVHKILKDMGTSYIILEDSICLANSVERCRVPDLIDLHNGHVPDDGRPDRGLIFSSVPRFCDQLRYGEEEYTKYFQLVFINKTFRVYKLT